MRGYYFITDHGLSAAGLQSDVLSAVEAGVQIIQYRNKEADTKTLYTDARLIRDLCALSPTLLVINDRIDIALAVDADGVHIGQDDMPFEQARRLLGPGRIIGVTVHNLEEAVAAERMGADYIGVSPVFATSTKLDAGSPCGIEGLKAIRKACSIPIVAIGGIDVASIASVRDAGADMVCAISAVVTRPDVAEEIRKIQKEFGL